MDGIVAIGGDGTFLRELRELNYSYSDQEEFELNINFDSSKLKSEELLPQAFPYKSYFFGIIVYMPEISKILSITLFVPVIKTGIL